MKIKELSYSPFGDNAMTKNNSLDICKKINENNSVVMKANIVIMHINIEIKIM